MGPPPRAVEGLQAQAPSYSMVWKAPSRPGRLGDVRQAPQGHAVDTGHRHRPAEGHLRVHGVAQHSCHHDDLPLCGLRLLRFPVQVVPDDVAVGRARAAAPEHLHQLALEGHEHEPRVDHVTGGHAVAVPQAIEANQPPRAAESASSFPSRKTVRRRVWPACFMSTACSKVTRVSPALIVPSLATANRPRKRGRRPSGRRRPGCFPGPRGPRRLRSSPRGGRARGGRPGKEGAGWWSPESGKPS